MGDLVLDEWLWSDLAGENTEEKQRQTAQFLEAIFRKCDRIVMVRDSSFARKALSFSRYTDRPRRGIARFFKDSFWYNSRKSVMLDQLELRELRPEIASKIKADDHYIVRAYLTSRGSVIVTTDNPLNETLAQHNIACKLRDEFVPGYVALAQE